MYISAPIPRGSPYITDIYIRIYIRLYIRYIISQIGYSPICIAASKGYTDVVKQLIAVGCDINLATRVKQMTPLAFAFALCNSNISVENT